MVGYVLGCVAGYVFEYVAHYVIEYVGEYVLQCSSLGWQNYVYILLQIVYYVSANDHVVHCKHWNVFDRG